MPDPVDLHQAKELFVLRCDADSTRLAYERELRRFLAWLDRPTRGCCERYVAHLREQGLSPTTIRWRATVAARFLRSAYEQGVIPTDVTSGFHPPKGTSGFAPRLLSERQLRHLLRTPDRRSHKGKRDLAILVCLGIGGLRAGEVCRLNCGDLDWQSRRVVLRVNGKGRKVRQVSLSGPAMDALRAYKHSLRPTREADQPLFFSYRQPPRRLTPASLDYILRLCCAAADLPRFSAHSLRHTAASLALEGGAPLHRVRDLMGHASVLTTSRYLHVAPGGKEASAYNPVGCSI